MVNAHIRPRGAIARLVVRLGLAASLASLAATPAHATEDNTSNVNLTVNVSNNYKDGRTHLEITIGSEPKIVRDYDFQVNVSNSSRSENGRSTVTVVIKKTDGKVVEVINR
jgi:hypothetical protein